MAEVDRERVDVASRMTTSSGETSQERTPRGVVIAPNLEAIEAIYESC